MEKQPLKRKTTAKQSTNKSTIKQKNSKQAVKVVYISNPMKVKTCASKFRALVQELTGQDADPTKFLDGGSSALQTTVVHGTDSQEQEEEQEEYSATAVTDDALSGSIRSDLDFQAATAAFDDDDMFMPMAPQTLMNMNMIDSFSLDGIVVPPSDFEHYETSGQKLMF